MKNLKLALIALIVSATSFGQTDFSKSVSNINWIKIESKAKIVVKGTEGNSMKIVVSEPYDVPQKAKGLRLVGNGGTDNTGVGFHISEENGTLTITNLRNAYKGEAEILVPRNKNMSIVNNGLDDIIIEGLSGEIEANASVTGSISITDVTGPLTIASNTGKVSVKFSKVNQTSPISISSSTGTIDVSLPENTPANLSLHSTMGEIFSNFDLSPPNEDGLRAVSTKKVSSSINNGGVDIKLTSSTGNIYLRKI